MKTLNWHIYNYESFHQSDLGTKFIILIRDKEAKSVSGLLWAPPLSENLLLI